MEEEEEKKKWQVFLRIKNFLAFKFINKTLEYLFLFNIDLPNKLFEVPSISTAIFVYLINWITIEI